jgi:hypothetical protein
VENIRTERTPPLWIAASGGYDLICSILIQHGANVNAKSVENTTALWRGNRKTMDCKWVTVLAASQKGHQRCVEVLLQNGANIECIASWGSSHRSCTPLWVAAQGGHVQMVELLLKHGASPNGISGIKTDKTPLQMATHVANMAKRSAANELVNTHKPVILVFDGVGLHPTFRK